MAVGARARIKPTKARLSLGVSSVRQIKRDGDDGTTCRLCALQHLLRRFPFVRGVELEPYRSAARAGDFFNWVRSLRRNDLKRFFRRGRASNRQLPARVECASAADGAEKDR